MPRACAPRRALPFLSLLPLLVVCPSGPVWAAVSTAVASSSLQLADIPDGSVELRRQGAVLAKFTLQTPVAGRGQPLVRELSVEGHAIAEVRVPVRGRAAEETWIGDLSARPARPVWSGLTGPRDADGEASLYFEVAP